MSANADMVARLALENRKLREDLERARLEKDRLERALLLSHQLQQECYEGWQELSHQNKLLRNRLDSAEVWERTREAAEDMGYAFKVHGGDGRP